MSPRQLAGHGTRACYLRGCRRKACTDANRRYCKAYRAATYRNGPRRIDATPARNVCLALSRDGWSEHQIGAAAGCSEGVIHHLLAGRRATLNPKTAAGIMRACPERSNAPRWTYLDATGTIRRGRALVAMGYQVKDLAQAVGLAHDPLSRILNRDPKSVRAQTARAMTALYGTWSRVPGPSQRSRDYAQTRGWFSPAAWDGDMDDPTVAPEPEPAPDPLDRYQVDEVLHLASFGIKPEEIAARTGLTTGHIKTQIKKARTTPLTLTA